MEPACRSTAASLGISARNSAALEAERSEKESVQPGKTAVRMGEEVSVRVKRYAALAEKFIGWTCGVRVTVA